MNTENYSFKSADDLEVGTSKLTSELIVSKLKKV